MTLPEPTAWVHRADFGRLMFSSSPTVPPWSFPVFTEDQVSEVLADSLSELEQENRLMRARMERLEAERTALLEAVCKRIGQACGPNSVAEMAVRAEFLTG